MTLAEFDTKYSGKAANPTPDSTAKSASPAATA